MPNPTSPSIPREFLGGVGFFFSLFLNFRQRTWVFSLQFKKNVI